MVGGLQLCARTCAASRLMWDFYSGRRPATADVYIETVLYACRRLWAVCPVFRMTVLPNGSGLVTIVFRASFMKYCAVYFLQRRLRR